MAIQFTSDLSSIQVLNAFNNNVVSFKSNSATASLDATITVGGVRVTITPNAGGLFTYNFIEIFKTIINSNHFRDGIYDGSSGAIGQYIFDDTNVYRDLTVQYKITLEDGNIETTSRSYRVLRSVVQLEDYRRNLTNAGNSSIALLSPFTQNSNKQVYATMFDGYPFDLAIYSSNFQNVVFKNKTTGYELTVALKRGVNRFFFSNGIANVTLDDDFPIALGVNEIEVYPSGASLTKSTLFLNKKEACSGHLLKWYNDFAGWCYFLFDENKLSGKFKDIGDFPSDFKNMNDTKDNFTGLGYSKESNIELFAQYLDINEKKYVNTLFGSPKIYLYLNGPFQEAKSNSWVGVKVDTSKVEDNFRYFKFVDFFFEIYRPLINTMTM
jgi:hypothetical protein